MTTVQPTSAPTADPDDRPLLDRQDERLATDSGIGGALRAFARRVRGGDIGALPVVVGLVIIWTVFQALNTVFLSAANLVNLLYDSSSVGIIALGIVCVLMLGEIDLSVGSVSGLSSAVLGVLWVNHGWPVLLAVAVAAACGAVIGFVYAQLYNRFGMPSFVATLAGLLAFLGLQLQLLGGTGSINLPYGSPMVNFGQQQFFTYSVAYIVAALAAGGYFASGYLIARRRRAAGLSAASVTFIAVRARRAARRAGSRRLVPQQGPRRAVDVRHLRRAGAGAELRPDQDEVGPVDDGRGR